MDYLDFELRIAAGDAGGYDVTFLALPAGGEGHGRLELPLADSRLRSCLETMEEVRSLPASRVLAVQEFGHTLFTSLTQEKSLYACYHTSLLEAQKSGKGLRLRLRCEPPELARLPWEYLYDSGIRRDFLGLSKETRGRARPISFRAPARSSPATASRRWCRCSIRSPTRRRSSSPAPFTTSSPTGMRWTRRSPPPARRSRW
ncbi:MAG TPA: hypothetical protein VGK45_05890, partial [Thermoanaerobaculia bacterium]